GGGPGHESRPDGRSAARSAGLAVQEPATGAARESNLGCADSAASRGPPLLVIRMEIPAGFGPVDRSTLGYVAPFAGYVVLMAVERALGLPMAWFCRA